MWLLYYLQDTCQELTFLTPLLGMSLFTTPLKSQTHFTEFSIHVSQISKTWQSFTLSHPSPTSIFQVLSEMKSYWCNTGLTCKNHLNVQEYHWKSTLFEVHNTRSPNIYKRHDPKSASVYEVLCMSVDRGPTSWRLHCLGQGCPSQGLRYLVRVWAVSVFACGCFPSTGCFTCMCFLSKPIFLLVCGDS